MLAAEGAGRGVVDGDHDHLFLLPERVLCMDSAQLRRDLAGLDFSARLLHHGPRGNVWLSGAAPADSSQRPAPGRPSAQKDSDLLASAAGGVGTTEAQPWFDSATDPGKENGGAAQKEREERIRALRERQGEERQRKLEELKQQALAAQRFREQKEEERRRRIEELRLRDNDRRHQVEERKRLIWEAEHNRREAILRKNMEREARIDTKRKNECSSIVFAFGSSTPRMLEPADTGGSFWGTRKATSTTNVMMFTAAPLTRRSSERELDGGKKRATSAGGLDRKPAEDFKMSTSMYEIFHWDAPPDQPLHPQRARSLSSHPVRSASEQSRSGPPVPTNLSLSTGGGHVRSYSSAPQTPLSRNVNSMFGGPSGGEEQEAADGATPTSHAASVTRVNRRKTDLMPTMPSPRDGARPGSARASLGRSPGRAYSMSRLDQLAQPRRPAPLVPLPEQQHASPLAAAMSRSMSHLAAGAALRRSGVARSMSHLGARPVPPPRLTRAEKLRQKLRGQSASGLRSGEITPTHPSRPQSALSQQSVASVNSGVSLRARPTATPRRQRPFSIAVTGVSPKMAVDKEGKEGKEASKPPLPRVHAPKKPAPQPKPEAPARKNAADRVLKAAKASPRVTPKATPLTSPGSETPPSALAQEPEAGPVGDEEEGGKPAAVASEPAPEPPQAVAAATEAPAAPPAAQEQVEQAQAAQAAKPADPLEQESEMTASMIAKTRITTEEEAKAALAERRRLAREQAEREAELEKQRQEEQERLEEERVRQEEEEQRRFEEEQLRLVEEARRAEEERLLQAIQENERREEEERKRREEEARAKAEREEMEKKAREEAERLRKEMDEKLKKEEEERVARRKRVEAIMLRTRQSKGGTPTGTPTKGQNDGDSEGENGREQSEQDAKGVDAKVEDGGDGCSGPSNGQLDGFAQARIGPAGSSSEMLIDSEVKHAMETSEDLITCATSDVLQQQQQQQQSNGHRNGILDFVNVDNITQNNLLDLSGFDSFGATNNVLNASQQPTAEFLFDPLGPGVGKITNEDNVNSNVINNGSPATLIAFDDNLSKKQDNNSVTDLLS
ncbi:ensconsin-like isoform X3 [Bacillus rossius redtenbacheri]|uniref:ensconsin-like isoform X3 n=1 Tax=Bacillus rossius redtenbacheri TaxID=93214 RepID=UPI002FDD6889